MINHGKNITPHWMLQSGWSTVNHLGKYTEEGIKLDDREDLN